VTILATTPILRIFDVAKARAFYEGYLGFHWDWEHRFGPDMPLYAQVSRDAATLHLSEHHGDATPGAALRLRVDDVAALHAELAAKRYRFASPGLDAMPWGETQCSVLDPFGNRLVFFTPEGGA
jgi:catechol 2,3-dioxygenase-like lactoylglutathione lyase family enzyme